MKTCSLICNLESGKGLKSTTLNQIIRKIQDYDYEVELHITQKPKDAENIVKNLKYKDLVLSIGGDGTFNEVVSGNYKRENKLLVSHIPVGTTNDIGTMLGLNKNIIKNVEAILEGTPKQIDIALINNHPYVYIAGFGKFINVPYATSRKFKKNFGYIAYLINGIKEFFQKTKLYELEYTVNNETYHGFYSLILISNANRIAGFNNVYKDVKLDDNQIEIVFCNISKRNDLVKSILILLKSDITNVPGLYCHKANEIEISFKHKPKLHWTIDGEKFKDRKSKYKITIDQSMKMLVPKKNIEKLFTK